MKRSYSKSFDYQVQKSGNQVLLGIAVDGAHIDICSTEQELAVGLRHLVKRADQIGSQWIKIGKFGEFPVTLYLEVGSKQAAIFIDGPDFTKGRAQSAAITVNIQSLIQALKTLVNVD